MLYPYSPPYSQESLTTNFPLQTLVPPHESNTLQPNQGRQPNTLALLTSFAAIPSHNAVVQILRQQSSNVDNCENYSDVQHYVDNDLWDSTHVGFDYDNVKAASVPPIQRFTDTIDTNLYAFVSPNSWSNIEWYEVLKVVISKVTQNVTKYWTYLQTSN